MVYIYEYNSIQHNGDVLLERFTTLAIVCFKVLPFCFSEGRSGKWECSSRE